MELPEPGIINVDSTSKTIILHPGSHSLKFGIASDPWPQFILHAVAFRTTNTKLSVLKSPIKIITKAKHTTGAFKITIKNTEKPGYRIFSQILSSRIRKKRRSMQSYRR